MWRVIRIATVRQDDVVEWNGKAHVASKHVRHGEERRARPRPALQRALRCALLRTLGFSFQKARFASDHLDEERCRAWLQEEWPALVRLARQRGALLTCGRRRAYKVFGLSDYFTGRLFCHGQTERFSAQRYCAFLATVLAVTAKPILLIQDGAKYHTAAATKDFIAAHADRLMVYQLPSYSPDYNPIEHLWKNMKRRTTHNRYFPEVDVLCVSVEDGLAYFQAHPAEVKRLMGTYLDHMAAAA
jgi:transposase